MTLGVPATAPALPRRRFAFCSVNLSHQKNRHEKTLIQSSVADPVLFYPMDPGRIFPDPGSWNV
jgi:hypothetical protein